MFYSTACNYSTYNFLKFDSLNIYYQNVRGLRTKTHEFLNNVCCNNYDLIVLTETWLCTGIYDSELFSANYNVYRRDRNVVNSKKLNGGGVLVAVSNHINSKRNINWDSACEDIWVTLELNKNIKLAICVAYIPPPVNEVVLDHFINNYNNIVDTINFGVLIIGDFNMSYIDWSLIDNNYRMSCAAKTFIDFCLINNLTQLNHIKNYQNKLLDLVLFNLDYPQVSVESPSRRLIRTDPLHPPLLINVSTSINKTAPTLSLNSSSLKYAYAKADYKSINKYLSAVNWDTRFSLCTNVNEMVDILYDVIYKSMDLYIPKIKIVHGLKHPPWFSHTLIKRIKEKEIVRQRYKKYNNPMDEIILKLLEKRCEKLSIQCYNAYVQFTEDKVTSNSKFFWSFLKRKKQNITNSYPAEMKCDNISQSGGQNICNLFVSHFSSIYAQNYDSLYDYKKIEQNLSIQNFDSRSLSCVHLTHSEIICAIKKLDHNKSSGSDHVSPAYLIHCAELLALPLEKIYNESLKTGIFPIKWKIAKIVPIFKSGDKTNVKNYRPISILSVFGKILESLVYQNLFHYFKQMFNVHQHGFINGRSTCTNLVNFCEMLIDAVDKRNRVDVIYTDFSKAFDLVPTSVLLQKLSSYGVVNSLLNWLKSYLTERQFYVVANGYESIKCNMTSGVPQGSHLSPLLFNIFINDLPNIFLFSTPFMYADDLKIVKTIYNPNDIRLLQEDLTSLYNWCNLNGMILNTNKCSHITFTKKKRLTSTKYYIGGSPVNTVETIRDLGIIFDKELTFVPHIDNIIGKASKMLGFVIRNSKIFKKACTKISLYKSLVVSILEYASVVWRPHYASHCLRIERLQKRFLYHLAFSLGKSRTLKSYADRLVYFRLDSLEKRREILDSLFLYKSINNIYDNTSLVQSFCFKVPRSTRMPSNLLEVPFRRSILGKNSPMSRFCKILNVDCALDPFRDSVLRFRRNATKRP